MKLTVNRKEMITALTIGGAMSNKSGKLSILDYSKVKVNDKQLVVSSNNGEVFVTKRIFVKHSDGEGEFCVNNAETIKFLKSLKDEDVTVEFEKQMMNIIHESGKGQMPTESADNFPTMAKSHAPKTFSVSADNMYRMLDKAKNFVGNSTIKPAMNGVYLFFENGQYGVCGCNERILFEDKYPYEKEEVENCSAIISPKAFGIILNTIFGADDVTISIDETNITFSVPDARVSCRLIDSRYPNYKVIFGKPINYNIKVNKDELIEVVTRAKMFSSIQSFLIVFDVKSGQMKLSSQDINFARKSSETCKVDYNGDNVVFGLNGELLLTCINAIDAEDVGIELNTPETPIFLHDELNADRRIMLMPMSTQP